MKFNLVVVAPWNKMIKQAKQVQEQIVKMQEELREREIETSAGGGAITVRINGKQVN